jgi:high-affinity iron transporter
LIPSIVLSLREGLEAALIIGIVYGALKKMSKPGMIPALWAGAGLAALLSVLAAVALNWLGAALEGPAEEIFEGLTMLTAAGILTWMIFWMGKQSRSLKSELESGARSAAMKNGTWGIFLLAFTAVIREGIELALFLTAAGAASNGLSQLWGGLIGLAAAALLGFGLFSSLFKLNLRQFFQVTSFLLILFAAGLAAHGVHELNEVGWIPAVVDHVWDINHLLPEASYGGQILTALFGYNANPSLTEVIAYGVYFVLLALVNWQFQRKTLVTTTT